MFDSSLKSISLKDKLTKRVQRSSSSEDFSLQKGHNNILSIQIEISGRLENWITPDELYGAI